MLSFFISQASAPQIPALTMVCVRRKVGESSNVTVPNLTREKNAREVWRKKSLLSILLSNCIYMYAKCKKTNWINVIKNILMVLFSKVQEFVKEVNAGMANVYWLQLLRTMSANASDPFSLQTAKLVCWYIYIYILKSPNSCLVRILAVTEQQPKFCFIVLQSFSL